MSQLLPYLLILVCPLTMGLMMWMMMRGMNHDKQPDPRVAELESQVASNDFGKSILGMFSGVLRKQLQVAVAHLHKYIVAATKTGQKTMERQLNRRQ